VAVANVSETSDQIADRWLSVDEIAAYLGVKRDTVYKWIERRRLPAHKAGRLWKFRKHEVDEWVLSKNARNQTHQKTAEKPSELSEGGR
jgi:excisionase family DNA binding protein